MTTGERGGPNLIVKQAYCQNPLTNACTHTEHRTLLTKGACQTTVMRRKDSPKEEKGTTVNHRVQSAARR